MENAIKHHNAKILEYPNKEKNKKACNCRNKTECPLREKTAEKKMSFARQKLKQTTKPNLTLV